MQESIISIQYLYPELESSFNEQISSLLASVKLLCKTGIPLKLTFFSGCTNSEDYHQKFSIVQKEKELKNIVAPVALICQTPATNKLALEIVTLKIPSGSFNLQNESDYLLLQNEDVEVLFTSTVSYKFQSFDENVKATFDRLNRIFELRGFQYSDVLRQWNYLEDILGQINVSNNVKQNYQVFNNYRSIQYEPYQFKNGYPVATGIGTNHGACCIEVIAVKGNNHHIIPIQNRRQVDAHRYSEQVLVGLPLEKMKKNTSPKFERAKFFESALINLLLVSGTASIIGEETVCIDDIEGQTHTTIDNIELLVEQAKSIREKICNMLNYRAYVKKPEDCKIVSEICNKRFGNKPGIILVSDICRDDLLVEIECNYAFN